MAFTIRNGSTLISDLGSRRGPQGPGGAGGFDTLAELNTLVTNANLAAIAGSDGQIKIDDVEGAGWQLKSADFTAVADGRYVVDDGTITITPYFAEAGETFEVYFSDPLSADYGTIYIFSYDGSSFTAHQYKDHTAYATAAQGTLADSAVQPASTDTLTNKTIAATSNTITGITNQIYHVRDEKASGTNAGSSIAGTQTRVLNTVVNAGITGASLSSNQVTMPAGTYMVEAAAPFYNVDFTQIYLYNITDAATEFVGMSGYNGVNTGGQSLLRGVITIASTKTFDLKHYTSAAITNNGLGVLSSSGQGEVYADLMFTKLY